MNAYPWLLLVGVLYLVGGTLTLAAWMMTSHDYQKRAFDVAVIVLWPFAIIGITFMICVEIAHMITKSTEEKEKYLAEKKRRND